MEMKGYKGTGKSQGQVTHSQKILRDRNRRLLSGELKPNNWHDYVFLHPELVDDVMEGLNV
jgi:hypothetical protein